LSPACRWFSGVRGCDRWARQSHRGIIQVPPRKSPQVTDSTRVKSPPLRNQDLVTLQIDDPYAVPGEFRKAQLHCHTTNSDGAFSPEKLLRMYRDAGYSFVCITDHNRVTRYEELNGRDFVAIHGTEDTVSRFLPPLGPHMGRLFVDAPLRDGSAQRRIDQTVAGGGIVSLCHPSWTGNLWTGAWSRETIDHLIGFHLVEIWNPHSNSEEDIRRWEAALRHAGQKEPVW